MQKAQVVLRCIIVAVSLTLAVGSTRNNQRAYAQEPAYQEDFEDGQAEGWELESGWSVLRDGDNQVLAGSGHNWARSNQPCDGGCAASFRVKVIRGTIHLVYRMNDAGRYFIGLDEDGSRLNKQYWPNDFRENLATSGNRHERGVWHRIEISATADQLIFAVDGRQEWTYKDPQPLETGTLAFETLDGAEAYVDDVLLTEPAQAITSPTEASASVSPQASDLVWVRTGGPLGGLGYDVRVRPDDAKKMYVTDAWAGVHISADGGMSWAPSNQGITTRVGDSGDGIPVFSLTIDPNNPEIIWVGTQYQRGIFKSIDGGQTWKKMDSGVTEGNGGITFRGFAVEQGNSAVVYAAGEVSSWEWAGKERQGREFDLTKGVVYKTTDGGVTWRAVWRGDNLARYVWIDPRSPEVLYVSTGIFDREAANSDRVNRLPGGEGILKSTDGGETWQHINQGLNNLYVGSLFMDPQRPDVLMAGTGNNQYHEASGVYLSENGGQSWIQTLSDDIITSVEISTSNPDVAYAGSSSAIYRSKDGGHSWEKLGDEAKGWGPPGVLAGFPIDFQVDADDPQRIFANEYGGGNFLSLDGGETWQVASSGYTGAQVRAVAVDPVKPGRVIAASRSGIFLSTNGGEDWTGINAAPYQALEWTAVAIDPRDPEHIASSNNWWNEVAYSLDGGGKWSFSNTVLAQGRAGWRTITFAPSDPGIIYAGSAGYYSAGAFELGMPGRGIWVSKDGSGEYWLDINTPLTESAHVTGLAVDKADAQRVYAATAGGGIVFTPDGGASWEERNRGLGGSRALSIAIDPADGQSLLTGLARGGIYRSNDGAQSWQHSSDGMPPEASISSIVYDPANANIVYAADLFSGVYLSRDGGKVWQAINNGLRMRSVNALALSSDGLHLYAGTEGEGVFRLDLNGEPPEPAARPEAPSSAATAAQTSAPAAATPAAPAPSGTAPCGSLFAIPAALYVWMHRKGQGPGILIKADLERR